MSDRARWTERCRRVGAWSLLLGCAFAAASGLGAPADAGLARVDDPGISTVVPGEFIVVLTPDAPPQSVHDAAARVRRLGGSVLATYRWALKGLSVRVPPGAEEALRALPDVNYVTPNVTGRPATTQSGPPKGLDRLDQRGPTFDQKYIYSETGLGVDVYVLDSGIRKTHDEFQGRVASERSFVVDGFGTDDCNGTGSGHGTHMAGTIGGKTYGVAKDVTLHTLKVVTCPPSQAPNLNATISAVDWLTGEVTLHPKPSVANMSLEFFTSGTTLDTAVKNSIAAGVTYVVAAGNDNGDACQVSPARVPEAITVGAVITLGSVSLDRRTSDSNFGTCVDLFAPGESVKSAWNLNDTANLNASGTSSAAAHVSGVAARFLQTHPLATPAAVWTAIHRADNVGTTPGWAGINDPGAGSPNELLHWGALNDGFDDGDPHLTTVGGLKYDFQSAGEFVLLRGDGVEIQARQTPVSTAGPLLDSSTGLGTCVSLNTAVAARVNGHRVTLQPGRGEGAGDPAVAAVRIDGAIADSAGVIDLGRGASLTSIPAGGVEVRFPDGTVLMATRNWWESQHLWYLSLGVFRTSADAGIIGMHEPGDWLPRLSDGSAAGAMPAAVPDRYLELYEEFADSWRVTDATSLFDYAPGTSTATFTLKGWPGGAPDCTVPGSSVQTPLPGSVAKRLCADAAPRGAVRSCLADVAVTGEATFADSYRLAATQRSGLTSTLLSAGPRDEAKHVRLMAVVLRPAGGSVPVGSVNFSIDGRRAKRVRLDRSGRATFRAAMREPGIHTALARFVSRKGTTGRSSQDTLRFRAP